MKRILFSLLACSAMAVSAQEAAPVEQSGIPAKLEAINGKMARVFLQKMENGTIMFQPYRSTQVIAVDASKVKSLEFFPKYDETAVTTAYEAGKFDVVLELLEPVMEEFWPYMTVENNLTKAFSALMQSYRGVGNREKANAAAQILMGSSNDELAMEGRVVLALDAINTGDFAKADELVGGIDDEVGQLFMKAATLRAKKQTKEAFQIVTQIIDEHGNNLNWMPQAEMLSAYLYLDSTIPSSTNSAANTARQVKNIYKGTHTAGEAAQFRASLGVIDKEPEPAAGEEAAEETPPADPMASVTSALSATLGTTNETESVETPVVEESKNESE